MATNPTTLNKRSGFASLLKAKDELNQIYMDEHKRKAEIFPNYMLVQDHDKQTVTENVLGPLGEWTSQTEGEDNTFAAMTQGTEVTVSHTTYKQAYGISQEMMEDDQWSILKTAPKLIAQGGRSIAESVASAAFDNAFTSGTGSDGSYLCVTSHNLINSGSTGSNASTDVFGADGLKAAYILGHNVVDDANTFIDVQYDTLLIPENLEQAAFEMFKSNLDPESNRNAANFYQGKIKKIVVCPWLSSDTAWFLIDSSSDYRPKFFWRVRPEFDMDIMPESRNALMFGRQRHSILFAGWQGVFGSTGV